MNKFLGKISGGVLVLCVLILISCSSAPKRAMKIYETYDVASQLYQNANTLITIGNYTDAATNLQQAYTMAVSIDCSSLVSKICLSGVSLKLAVPKDFKMPAITSGLPILHLESANLYSMAVDAAERSDEKDFLVAVCKIFRAQIYLKNKIVSEYDSILDDLRSSEKAVSKDPFYSGILDRTLGDLYAVEKKYSQAADCYRKACKVHLDNRYVYEIGQDYYYLARVQSLNGDKKSACDSILSALKHDRDSENTSAIATDYYAYASILIKEPYTKSDMEKALSAANSSALIFAAGNFNAESEKSQKLASNLKDRLAVEF